MRPDCCCNDGTTLIEPLLAKDQLAAAQQVRPRIVVERCATATSRQQRHRPSSTNQSHASWSASAAVVARAPLGSCADHAASQSSKGASPQTPNQKSSSVDDIKQVVVVGVVGGRQARRESVTQTEPQRRSLKRRRCAKAVATAIGNSNTRTMHSLTRNSGVHRSARATQTCTTNFEWRRV